MKKPVVKMNVGVMNEKLEMPLKKYLKLKFLHRFGLSDLELFRQSGIDPSAMCEHLRFRYPWFEDHLWGQFLTKRYISENGEFCDPNAERVFRDLLAYVGTSCLTWAGTSYATGPEKVARCLSDEQLCFFVQLELDHGTEARGAGAVAYAALLKNEKFLRTVWKRLDFSERCRMVYDVMTLGGVRKDSPRQPSQKMLELLDETLLPSQAWMIGWRRIGERNEKSELYFRASIEELLHYC